MQPAILIPILIMLVGGIGYYFYTKMDQWWPRKRVEGSKGDDNSNAGMPYQPEYAYIHNNKTRKEYEGFIPAEKVADMMGNFKTLGENLTFSTGKKGYEVTLKENGDYEPVLLTPPGKNDDPYQLYYETNHPEMSIYMKGMFENKSLLAKYGQVLWWIAVMGFLMFMWSQS